MVQNGIRFVKNTLNIFPLKSVYIDKSCPRKKSHSRTRSTLSEPAFQHFLTTSGESLTWQTKILLPWKSLLWRLPLSSINFHSLERAQEVIFFPSEGQKYVMSMSSDICNFCLCATGCQKFSAKAASRAPRFKTTWSKNDGLRGQELVWPFKERQSEHA